MRSQCPYKPTEIEIERRNRIRLSVCAYMYEILGIDTLMDDLTWTLLARKIRPEMSTGHAVMDKFFREEFYSCTGVWIHKHPELDKLDALYNRISLVWDGIPRVN